MLFFGLFLPVDLDSDVLPCSFVPGNHQVCSETKEKCCYEEAKISLKLFSTCANRIIHCNMLHMHINVLWKSTSQKLSSGLKCKYFYLVYLPITMSSRLVGTSKEIHIPPKGKSTLNAHFLQSKPQRADLRAEAELITTLSPQYQKTCLQTPTANAIKIQNYHLRKLQRILNSF